MGNKKEAVREILKVVPQWPREEAKCIRLDSDGEILTCDLPADQVIANLDTADSHRSWGYSGSGIRSWSCRVGKTGEEEPSWYVPFPNRYESGEYGLIAMPISRMEYEIFRAAILKEMGDDEREE